MAASTAVGDTRVPVKLRRFEAAAATLDITPKAADLRLPTHTCRCYLVSSSDIRIENSYPPKVLKSCGNIHLDY